MAWGRVLSLRLRAATVVWVLLCGLTTVLPSVSEARQDTRTLKLHFTHTGERGVFTFRRNGQYDRKELDRINQILRDWRRGQTTRMDPALLDLLWEIHRRTGSDEYIHVISAFRSQATNESLRRRSSGVAKNSQHTRGKAMDFFIPGVPLDKLRAIALTLQGGGVGYYPGSGSPFVHVDTGSVRHWPRMTRKQLVALFPSGETLHIPSDGKPLPGYKRAVAMVKSGRSISVASAAASSSRDSAGVSGWLQRVFSRGEGDSRVAQGRPANATQPAAVAAAEPRQSEPPQAVPAPRPDEAPETVLAELESDEAEAAALAAIPRPVPAKMRALLMAARDRARLIEIASAASEPPPAPADAPARPAAPAAVASLGGGVSRTAPDATSADAALAGLYATARGGNPEPGATRPMNAAVVQPEQAYAPLRAGATQPAGELAVALLEMAGMPDASRPASISNAGPGEAAVANVPRSSPASAGPAEEAEPKVKRASLSPGGPAAAEVRPEDSGPLAEAVSAPPAVAMPLVAVRLDQPLLRRLMSQETTRTGAFGLLARPQPRPDIYFAPAEGGSRLALADLAWPRTDRFQNR